MKTKSKVLKSIKSITGTTEKNGLKFRRIPVVKIEENIRVRYFISEKFIRPFFVLILLSAFLLSVISNQLSTPKAFAAVGINRQINFQGKVVNKVGETNITNGSYSFTFKFFDAASGGTQLPSGAAWTETKNLTVTDGIFRTALGDTTAIPAALNFNSDNIWLDMTFNGETFTTRIRMSAVAYAFNAEKVNGLTVTNTSDNPFTAATTLKIGDGKTAIFNNTVTFSGTDSKTLTLNDSTTLNTHSIVFAAGASQTLTLASGKSVTFGDAFTTSGAFATTLTSTGITSVTLPTTGTLLTNTASAIQTITSTQTSGTILGITDATNITAAIKGQVITLSGTGAFDQTGLEFNLSGATGTNLNDIVGSGSTWKVSKSGAAVFSSIGATGAGTGAFTTLTSSGATTLGTGPSLTNTFGSGASSINTIGSTTTPGALTLHGATSLDNTFAQTVSSTTAFQVQNTSSAPILKVDTATNNSNNLVTNPSIESAISGNWVAKGSATVAQDATDYYYGANSLKIQTTAVAGDGARQAVSLTSATNYTMSVYVRSSAGNMTTFEIGRADNGSTDTACLTAQAALKNGWTRYTCNFLTGTVSGSPYIYVKQTDATARNSINIDAVILQTEANYTPVYHEGQIALQGKVTTPLIIQNTSNSSTAFQVSTSKGACVFCIDTSDANILAGNAGFEVTQTGWTYSGTPGSVIRDSSQNYTGSYSLKVVTTANTNNGAKFTLASGSPAVPALSTNTAYTISWYARLDSASAAFTDMIAAYARDGSTESNCTGINTQTVAVGGWTRFTCTFTTDATTPAAGAYLIIKQTAATAHTFYIDSVQLELGATGSSGYGAGSINLNAMFTSPTIFRGTSNATTAFQIENAAGSDLFVVDTLNRKIDVSAQLNAIALSAPTLDLATIANTGFGTTTTGVDGLQIDLVTAAIAGSMDNAGLRLAINPVGATEAGDTVEAIDIAAITNPTGVASAIRVGANWDNILDSATLDISGPGVITGATGITSSGTVTFSGLTAGRAVFSTTGGQLTSTGASADLLNSLTDETGTGVAVFGTSPAITTSLTTASTTFALINTAATTVNFAGGATTALNIGSTTTGLNTFNAEVDMTFGAGENLNITAGAAPTVDMMTIANTGFGTATTAIDGLQINFATAAVGGNVDNAGLRLVIDPVGATGASDTVEAIDIAAITNPTGLTTAIRVGTGWDASLDVNGASNAIIFRNLTSAASNTNVCFNTTSFVVTQMAACGVSSRRFKHDIESLPGGYGLDLVRNLRPVSFKLNSNNKEELGFVAEEVAEYEPRLVIFEEDGVTPYSLDYNKFVSVLAKAVQELDQKVEGLKFASGTTHDESFVKTLSIDTFKAYTGRDIALQLTQDGKFIIKDENGSDAITFDNKGNGSFKGTVSSSKVQADQIVGLEFISTPKVNAKEIALDKIQARTGQDVALHLTKDGKFIIKDENGEPAITFDADGNGTFKGTITADKIKANQIEGLEFLVRGITGTTSITSTTGNENTASDSASLGINASVDNEASSSSNLNSRDTRDTLDTRGTLAIEGLAINGNATVSADLRVKGNGLVEGVLSVIDSLMTNNLIVNGIADFFNNVVFHKNVAIKGIPTFNQDTAGYIMIQKGSNRVQVKFVNEYEDTPVINASLVTKKLTDEAFDQYKNDGTCDTSDSTDLCQEKIDQLLLAQETKFVISDRSKKGFSIVIEKNAQTDIDFSWSAFSVSDKLGLR